MRQLAQRRYDFSPSTAMSMATAMIVLLVDRCSRGHTITYCLCDVQNDALLMLIVDDAPGVARIRVAALQQPVFGSIAKLFKPTNFGSFVVSPVRAGKWNSGHTSGTY
jgi:hypothetical protein